MVLILYKLQDGLGKSYVTTTVNVEPMLYLVEISYSFLPKRKNICPAQPGVNVRGGPSGCMAKTQHT